VVDLLAYEQQNLPCVQLGYEIYHKYTSLGPSFECTETASEMHQSYHQGVIHFVQKSSKAVGRVIVEKLFYVGMHVI